MVPKEMNKVSRVAEPHLVEREPIKRERLVIAGVLLIVMGGLWVRVLLKKSPAAAQAEASPTTVSVSAEPASARVRYRALPVVAGRHDRPAVDVFSSANWPELGEPTEPEPVAPRVDGRREQARAALEALTVEAMTADGDRTEAMLEIGGRYHLVSPGSTFEVRYQGAVFSLRVVAIEANRLVVAWDDMQREIRIPGPEAGPF